MKAPRSKHYWVATAIFAAAFLVASFYRPVFGKGRAEYSEYYQLKPTIPGTSPVWDVGPMPNIYLNVENTVHY
ncbi:hypothetical protein B0H19DRAFT_1257097 [Mycena capillaripes]|nr:hypothetical protein B0H19DRAFT_1257097 [Mycena capillaripes]